MRILPVIDLLGQRVVRGMAGLRSEYRPLTSPLCADAQPATLARSLVDRFGFREAYLADLDAIGGAEPAWSVYSELAAAGLGLWIDAGLGDLDRARDLAALPSSTATRIIAGLESLPSRALLIELLDAIGRERLVFSLDLQDGRPLARAAEWAGRDALSIGRDALALGVRSMIILDLAAVGMGGGSRTEALARSFRQIDSQAELIGGGGVRWADDLAKLEQAGYDVALVATALHKGRGEEIRPPAQR
jgi:phosphoribosylformimino-5-aminoimidazole carboxamide ribotide isomerase